MKITTSSDLIRLKQIIMTDNINIPNSAIEVLKTDTKSFLRNHFKFDDKDFKMDIVCTEKGTYEISLGLLAKEMYDVKIIR